MLIVTGRLSRAFHRLRDDFPPRRKRTPDTYNDMKPEKFRQLSLQKRRNHGPGVFSLVYGIDFPLILTGTFE